MTIASYFYDSTTGDPRTYSAVDFANAFNIIMATGVIPKNDTGALGLDIGGTNYTTIFAGKATVKGHFVEVTGEELLTVPPGTYSGAVVLRVDFIDTRNATLIVKPDQTTQDDESAFELKLYNCSVSNGVITGVTDVRVRGGAAAKLPDNIPYFYYADNGVYLQIGTYSLALTPAQPPAAAKRVWIQVDN